MSLANRGNDFNFFYEPNKAIWELKNRKWVQKSTIFGQIDIRVLAILRVQKVVSNFFGEKTQYFFSFIFLNVFRYQGTWFLFFSGPNKAILELKNQKWVQKLTIFDQIDIHVLAILGVQKVVFWTFSKLFKTCLGSI